MRVFTSYYDDLSLLRTGKLSLEQYLTGLAKTISRLERAPANTRQSPGGQQLSTPGRGFYRQDENAANAIVSYYAKGSLLAFCLDAETTCARADTGWPDAAMLAAVWRAGMR